MKARKTVLFVLAALVVLCLGVSPAPAAERNPFVMPTPPFKTAIVKYKMSGTQQGSETLYIDGLKRANHTDATTSMFGMSVAQKTIMISSPEKIINIDLEKRTGTETGNMLTYLAQEYEKLSSAEKAIVRKNAEKTGRNVMGMMPGGSVKMSKGSLMGKPVDIVQAMGLTTYSWSGSDVMLKTEGSIGPMNVNTVATSVDTNVSLPGEAFAIPEGVNVVFDEQSDQAQRDMAKNWIEALKDPEFEKKGAAGMGAMFGGAAAGKAGQQPQEPAEQTGSEAEPSDADAMQQGMKVLQGLLGN